MSDNIENLMSSQEIANQVCRILLENMQPVPEFAPGTIPVKTAASILGKAATWIQAGIICGWLPIGYATLDGKLVKSLDEIRPDRRIDYTIIPKKFWEVTGYVWRGKEG